MPRPLRPVADGLVYHVINRGNNRQTVFGTEGDYLAFLKAIADLKKRIDFDFFGYCFISKPTRCALTWCNARASIRGAASGVMRGAERPAVRSRGRLRGPVALPGGPAATLVGLRASGGGGWGTGGHPSKHRDRPALRRSHVGGSPLRAVEARLDHPSARPSSEGLQGDG